MILKKLVVGSYASNCYIVGSEATMEGMIIDPGAGAQQILMAVQDLGLDIKLIVITHAHVDHIGVAREVKEATGAEVAIHVDDAQFLAQRRRSSALSGLSFPTPPSLDRLLRGGDSIDIGDLHFLVLHTPGHSPGGICLFGDGVVFTGDTLFNYSVGRTDFADGSHHRLIDGIQTKLMILPDNTVVCPGHGPDSTIGNERWGNPFLRD